ncbi:hypothetical protein MKMG_00804 [Methanogenium sp. MK-MG]|nr:hypothetical protein MKMG_00804 [Methanogenium sp. MK-MG]
MLTDVDSFGDREKKIASRAAVSQPAALRPSGKMEEKRKDIV